MTLEEEPLVAKGGLLGADADVDVEVEVEGAGSAGAGAGDAFAGIVAGPVRAGSVVSLAVGNAHPARATTRTCGLVDAFRCCGGRRT